MDAADAFDQILRRIDAGAITDRILRVGMEDAQEQIRQIVAETITAGQDAGREIVRLEREAALAAAKRESDAAVLRLLGTDASRWAPAFMDALMATPEPDVEDDAADLTKWMAGQEALAHAYFANAIEAGRDAGVRQERDRARSEPAIAGATTRGQIEENLTAALDAGVAVIETFAGGDCEAAGNLRAAVADALDLIHTQSATIAGGADPGATDALLASVDTRRFVARMMEHGERSIGSEDREAVAEGFRRIVVEAITGGIVAAQVAYARGGGGALSAPIADEVSLGIAKGGAAVKAEPLLRLFRFGHLRSALADLSRPFARLATFVAEAVPRSAERTLALRALWDAKNLAVVAVAQPPDDEGGRPPGVPAASR